MALSIPNTIDLDDSLRQTVEGGWSAFAADNPQLARRCLANESIASSIARVWACSEFVQSCCLRWPDSFARLLDSDALLGSTIASNRQSKNLDNLVQQLMATAEEAPALLRRFRRLEMMRIAWRDLAGWANLDETLADLSALADGLVQTACDQAVRDLGPRYGLSLDRAGEVQPMIVLGMGKLGGGELNFSSDIDLVFVYPDAGESSGPKKIPNEMYFTRLGRRLIELLNKVTDDGFVYRVDMRLRPFGEAGPLALNFDSFENYLQQHGRSWERYAYIKARALTGHKQAEPLFKNILRPFVYRKYIDFGVFESLRDMKSMIEQEVERRDLVGNIKLGSGGIREIEFIAQSLQLIRGGRDRKLRERSLLSSLSCLAELNFLPPTHAATLRDGYIFLRKLENHMQQIRDEQTHDVPDDLNDRQRLVEAMGSDQWNGLQEDIDRHRRCVNEIFNEIVFGPVSDELATSGSTGISGIWEHRVDAEQAAATLSVLGFSEAGNVVAILAKLRDGAQYRQLDTSGQQRLDQLIPALVRAAAHCDEPASTLMRLVSVVEAVGRRSAYFALLTENPAALQRLVDICDRSDFLSGQIARHPLLLDELLDNATLETPPQRDDFERELASRFDAVRDDDHEARINVLHQFQRAAVFRVAVADLNDRLPLMKVSDRLTDVAELVLDKTLEMARANLLGRHGQPRCTVDGITRDTGFAIIAYGKLGGLELGYGSDLDVVFLHDSCGEAQHTDGSRVIENSVFYSRLARRIVNLLSIQTGSGGLYAVDMRLRPSGSKGLLVSSIPAFERYQLNEAWVWEHQALLRARAVAGDESVCVAFENVRKKILSTAVDESQLRSEVRKMRERMRTELGSQGNGFDLKQGEGGIADIEFMVQFLVLESASQNHELLQYSDNIRQLEGLAEYGCLDRDTADKLTDAYRNYRRRLHHLSLTGSGQHVHNHEFMELRDSVRRAWQRIMRPELL